MASVAAPAPSPPQGWRVDAAVTLLALIALIAWDASGADLWFARAFGTAQGFAWREDWLTSQVLHSGGRWLGIVVFVALIVNLWRPLLVARGLSRRMRLWWLLATVACLVVIPLLKARSLVSCPWDLAEFGGAARLVSHWSAQAWTGPGDGGSGRCFPSGHASTAFSFLAGWFVLRGHSVRAARAWLAGVLVLGAVFSAAQLMRGAHYPSHSLWTAWICWALTALLWHTTGKVRRAAGPGAGVGQGGL